LIKFIRKKTIQFSIKINDHFKRRTVLASRPPPLPFFSAAAFFLFFDEVFLSSVPVAADTSSREIKDRKLKRMD